MSAARLAAESAFSVSRPASFEARPTVITVRRSRGLAAEAANGETIAGVDHAASATPAKGPRIFRLGPAAPLPASAGDADSNPQPSASSLSAAAVSGSSGKRRLADHQRPGPVVQIFKAAVGPCADSAVVNDPGLTREQVAVLADLLASIQPVLEDIRSAQAFRVIDDESANTWQSFAMAAEKIRRQIP